MELKSDYLIGEYPKVFKVVVNPSWSCYYCQSEVKNPFWFDSQPYCNYKHAFRTVWRIVFGEIEKVSPERREAYKLYFRMELPEEIVWEEGWSDSQIENCYVGLFNIPMKARQDTAFEIVKYIMNKVSKEVPDYAK